MNVYKFKKKKAKSLHKNNEKILELKQVHKFYNNTNNEELEVLNSIDFTIHRGNFYCVLGPSGCGKTTLLNIIAGFIPHSYGEVLMKGNPIEKPGRDRCVIFQEDTLFPWLTVNENISFGLKHVKRNGHNISQKVDYYLSLVGLEGYGNYLPKEISVGMKQRVALARVLILNPEVILMDEPFASLDYQIREDMQNLVLRLSRELNHTILFVTHDVSEAAKLADRILIFDKNPGIIKKIIDVNLDKPRDEDDEAFIKLRKSLKKEIRNNIDI